MARSKLADRSVRHDRFHQKAKKQGFLARAVFKLEELDEQFKLFKPGQRVLDLGCAPGSWLQYARTRVGDRGILVGLDRAALRGDGVPHGSMARRSVICGSPSRRRTARSRSDGSSRASRS